MTLDCFKSFTASLHLQNQVQTPCVAQTDFRGPVPAFVSTHSVTCDLPASHAQLLAFLNKPYSATTQCPLVLNTGLQESCPHLCYHHVYFCTSSLSPEHPACISCQFSLWSSQVYLCRFMIGLEHTLCPTHLHSLAKCFPNFYSHSLK